MEHPEYQRGFRDGYQLGFAHYYQEGIRHGHYKGAVKAAWVCLAAIGTSGIIWLLW